MGRGEATAGGGKAGAGRVGREGGDSTPSPEALLATGRRPSSGPQEWTSWTLTSLIGIPGTTMTCYSGWVVAPMGKSSR